MREGRKEGKEGGGKKGRDNGRDRAERKECGGYYVTEQGEVKGRISSKQNVNLN